jgi:hypothetical protein
MVGGKRAQLIVARGGKLIRVAAIRVAWGCVTAIRSYWQQRIFSGRDVPPPELDLDEAVVSYVLAHRRGVGYVSATAKPREAKVVQIR